jgi:3-phosphoshikimate 1-carboxyvinyltransferase
VYAEIWLRQGLVFAHSEDSVLPLRLGGQLQPGVFPLRGDISSQFLSGLCFALPLLDGDSEIVLTTALVSAPYLELTLSVLRDFGIEIKYSEGRLAIKGRQTYQPRPYQVEGDYSQAAFWLTAAALGSAVSVTGLDPRSVQGDRYFLELLPLFRPDPSVADADGVIPLLRRTTSSPAPEVKQGERLAAATWRTEANKDGNGRCAPSLQGGSVADADGVVCVINISGCPDLVPILSLLAALTPGVTEIQGAATLRLKESDRLSAISTELGTLGAKITEQPDGLRITGVPRLHGGRTVCCHNDHRIAMTLAIAATVCDEPLTLDGWECVSKSYPNFFDEFAKLGGTVQSVD